MAMGQFKHDFINLHGLQDPSFQSTAEYLAANVGSRELYPKDPYIVLDDEVTEVADEYIPVGTTRLPVKDISNFRVGDQVVVERQSSKNWIQRLGMDHIPKRPDDPERTMDWHPRQYDLRFVRKIKAIELRGWEAGHSSGGDWHSDSAGSADVDSRPEEAMLGANGSANKLQTQQQQHQQASQPLEQPQEQVQELKVVQDARQVNNNNGPQSILRYTADTNRTGQAQPLEAEEDFEEIQITLQEDSSSSNDNSTNGEGTNTNGTPGFLHLDIPLVMNMDPVYGPGIVYNFERETHIPTDVGIENLALYSHYDPSPSNPFDEHHGWYAVLIDHCENCWVANIKTHHFVSGIKAAPGSKHVTIQDSEVLTPVSLPKQGGRRYMFMLQGQMGLVKRCFSEDGRHDFITGSKTLGPNVFVDSEGVRANNDAGPHGKKNDFC
jgi:hypothetical protein